MHILFLIGVLCITAGRRSMGRITLSLK
jgi:hypothetical protein